MATVQRSVRRSECAHEINGTEQFVNCSRYLGNNPTNATDPSGLQPPRVGEDPGTAQPRLPVIPRLRPEIGKDPESKVPWAAKPLTTEKEARLQIQDYYPDSEMFRVLSNTQHYYVSLTFFDGPDNAMRRVRCGACRYDRGVNYFMPIADLNGKLQGFISWNIDAAHQAGSREKVSKAVRTADETFFALRAIDEKKKIPHEKQLATFDYLRKSMEDTISSVRGGAINNVGIAAPYEAVEYYYDRRIHKNGIGEVRRLRFNGTWSPVARGEQDAHGPIEFLFNKPPAETVYERELKLKERR